MKVGGADRHSRLSQYSLTQGSRFLGPQASRLAVVPTRLSGIPSPSRGTSVLSEFRYFYDQGGRREKIQMDREVPGQGLVWESMEYSQPR